MDEPKGPADFRARREELGASQSDLAAGVGVKTLSVKRWESGERPLPQAAWDWLETQERACEASVQAAAWAIAEAARDTGRASLPYYRSQAEYEAETGRSGPFAVANAQSRRIARELRKGGIEIRFEYAKRRSGAPD